jgi:hypothetical protein
MNGRLNWAAADSTLERRPVRGQKSWQPLRSCIRQNAGFLAFPNSGEFSQEAIHRELLAGSSRAHGHDERGLGCTAQPPEGRIGCGSFIAGSRPSVKVAHGNHFPDIAIDVLP